MKPRVVFDCMVFLQGAARPGGPAAECLRRAEAGDVELCLSADVVAEVRDVLARPKIVKKFPSLTPETVAAFLARLASSACEVADVPKRVPLPRDPKDEKYLDLAVAAGASYVVSRDDDLLDLMDETKPDGAAFRAAHPELKILDPSAFLARLGPRSEP